MSFIQRPTYVCEGTVKEIRIAYDEYGVVSIQQAPLDDQEFSDEQAIMVLEAALSVLKADQVIARPTRCASGSRQPDGLCLQEFNCGVGVGEGTECCCDCRHMITCKEICTSVTSFTARE